MKGTIILVLLTGTNKSVYIFGKLISMAVF